MNRCGLLIALAMAAVALASACGQTGNTVRAVEMCRAEVATLRQTLQNEPVAYAARKAAQGDYRYLEFHGFASVVPGIKDQECVHQGEFSVWLVGTSDALCTEDHLVLNERAYKFASSFNARMALLRESTALATCNGDG